MSIGSIEEPVLHPRGDESDDRPLGIRFIEYVRRKTLSHGTYQAIVLVVTFFTYTTYHLARKTTSVVKSALDPDSSLHTRLTSSGWAPFNGSDGTELLGYLDLAFLLCYAIGEFFSGQLGDRFNLRVFLTIGMLGTGLFTASFGFAYWLNIHEFYYFLGSQMLAGLLQSTGWPSVVAVVGNWFGKGRRGLVMGIWNAHTSLGNIAGSLIASNLLDYGWGWSLVVPGLIIAAMGLVVFVFLPVNPLSVQTAAKRDGSASMRQPLLGSEITDSCLLEPTENGEEPKVAYAQSEGVETRAIGFIDAWKIPGVAIYAFSLFFAKLVSYTFLYWLPFYINYTEIGGEYLSSEASGNLSTLFDFGGVVGGVLAGLISDQLNSRAITAAVFSFGSVPALFFYKTFGSISIYVNGTLMFVTGLFVNAPYALITTAVSADLGSHSSSRALATVAAIIDGTGSVGAAIGPLATGYISDVSWSAVFIMLMSSSLLAGCVLMPLVAMDIKAALDRSRRPRLGLDLHR